MMRDVKTHRGSPSDAAASAGNHDKLPAQRIRASSYATHLKLGYGAAWCVPRHDLMWEVTATTDVCGTRHATPLKRMLHPHGIESRE
jgi:hypothetical protein